MNSLRRPALAFALVALLAGCGGASLPSNPGPHITASPVPTATPTPGPSPGGPQATATPQLYPPQAKTIYLGLYADPGGQRPPAPNALSQVEQAVGRTMALSLHYYGFFDTFPGAPEADDLANGRIPVESWDCQPSNAAIASGTYDNNVRAVADNIKAYGHPVFLRYMWEMNLPVLPNFRAQCYDANYDEPDGKFSPAYYIAAWNHLRQIFAQEGATNAVWLWCPSGANDPLEYFPGAGATQWNGFDQYDDTDVPFDQTFQQAYGWLKPLGLPIIISETGASANTQPAFFNNAVSGLKSDFPLVKGFVYFDSPHGAYQDWLIKQGTPGFTAFVSMAKDPYFSAKAP